MAREQINRGRLRAQIEVQQLEDGTVYISCPAEVSERLYSHLVARQISSEPPKRAMFDPYPRDLLVVASSRDKASAEVSEFIRSLPEICYERDVALIPKSH